MKSRKQDKAPARGQGAEVIEAIHALAKEKGLSEEMLFTAIESAMQSAYKKNLPKDAVAPANIVAMLDRQSGDIHIYARLLVTEEVENPANEISLEEARTIRPGAELDDIVEKDVTPAGFLRVAAQAARQIIIQQIRKAESGQIYDEYIGKSEEILTGVVKRVSEHSVIVELDHAEGILEEDEMIPGEVLQEEDHIKVYVLQVLRDSPSLRAPQVRVSRKHPSLVKRLFEMEVPEIVSGVVTIKAIARKAGVRTKMAVDSADPMVDPVGACVGQRGGRVERVVAELKGEKVDIIRWSPIEEEFVAHALNPAHVINVYTSTTQKRECRVVVPDNQLSLAIGKEGLNSFLAHQLTGWKIEIMSQSQAAQRDDMVDEGMPMVQTGSMRMEHDETVGYQTDDSDISI